MLAVAVLVTVPAVLTSPASLGADAVPEVDEASHPCATGLMPTCLDMTEATCVIFNPYGGPPYVLDDACDSDSPACG